MGMKGKYLVVLLHSLVDCQLQLALLVQQLVVFGLQRLL